MAQLLQELKGESYHYKAYQKASIAIEGIGRSVCSFTVKELESIPSIGKVISREIEEYCRYGKIKYLNRLLNLSDPATILCLAAEIDTATSRDIVESLNINNFDELLREYESGRLKRYCGEKSSEYQVIIELLEFLPSWLRNKHISARKLASVRPSTKELLDFDKNFRSHHIYGPTDFKIKEYPYKGGLLQVSYSISEKAQKFESKGDWVNIHFIKGDEYLKWIVLTSKYGALKGMRIVLGEEKASRDYYQI